MARDDIPKPGSRKPGTPRITRGKRYERRENPTWRHRFVGWLEKPGERTRIDAYVEKHDHEGVPRPEQWDRVVERPEGPLHPPGYDFWISTLRITAFLLVFAWMPIFNGAFAGLMGGWRAGNMRRALGASLLAVVAVGGALFLAFEVRGHTLNFFYGLSLTTWLLMTLAFTLLGAWTGVACRWAIREEHGPTRRWTEGPWSDPVRRDWVEG